MAEPTDNTSEVVRATPPDSEAVNNGVDSDTVCYFCLYQFCMLFILYLQVGSKKDRKSHTPTSLSRTQLPPSATPEERASLEKLKQKMEFVDDSVGCCIVTHTHTYAHITHSWSLSLCSHKSHLPIHHLNHHNCHQMIIVQFKRRVWREMRMVMCLKERLTLL